MTRELFRLINFWLSFSTILPLLCFLIYKRKQPRQNVILASSLLISLLFDIIVWTLANYKISNHLYINLYHIISFPVIMFFYHETLTKKLFKIVIRIFIVIFFSLAAIFAMPEGLSVFNNDILTLSSILITVTSCFFVGDLGLMDDSNFARNPFHQSNIILNTSLAVYYFATIVIFEVSDYIFANLSPEDVRLFWTFHNVVHLLKNLGIAIAFYLCARQSHLASQRDIVRNN